MKIRHQSQSRVEDIEGVEEFPYLGSTIASFQAVDPDMNRRVTHAAHAFGALRKAVFLDKDLSLATKRKVCYGPIVWC